MSKMCSMEGIQLNYRNSSYEKQEVPRCGACGQPLGGITPVKRSGWDMHPKCAADCAEASAEFWAELKRIHAMDEHE